MTDSDQSRDLSFIITIIVVITLIAAIAYTFWPSTPVKATSPSPQATSQVAVQASQPAIQPAPQPAIQPVIVYSDCDYKGSSASFLPGTYDITQIKIPNDSLSSVKVPAGRKIQLFEHNPGQGRTITLTQDTPCLVSAGFNDTASSWIVS